MRKTWSISLPSSLEKEANKIIKEENRTRSELVREALKWYFETREAKRAFAKEKLFELIDHIQERNKKVNAKEVRRAVKEAIKEVRRQARD